MDRKIIGNFFLGWEGVLRGILCLGKLLCGISKK